MFRYLVKNLSHIRFTRRNIIIPKKVHIFLLLFALRNLFNKLFRLPLLNLRWSEFVTLALFRKIDRSVSPWDEAWLNNHDCLVSYVQHSFFDRRQVRVRDRGLDPSSKSRNYPEPTKSPSRNQFVFSCLSSLARIFRIKFIRLLLAHFRRKLASHHYSDTTFRYAN